VTDLINARENYKDMPDKKTAIRTFDGGNLLSGVDYDNLIASYPTSVTENYKYYKGVILVAEILITYTNASKQLLSKVERLS